MIVDRYLSSQIFRPFAAGLGLLVMIFIGYSAARYLALAAEGRMDTLVAFKLIGLNVVVTLEILLPTALFFSVLSAIGRLYRDAEMYAIYASGISRARILESVFKFALLIALITGFISIVARPWAFRTSYNLEAQMAANFTLKKVAAGNFVTLADSGYVFFAKGFNAEQGLHHGVFLFKKYAGIGRSEILVAEAAALPDVRLGEAMQAQFYNGFEYMLDDIRQQDVTLKYEQLTVSLPEGDRLTEKYRARAESTVNLARSPEPKDIAEFQWRMTTPLATVLLALIAVPLSRMEPRNSRFRNFFFALLVYVALFSITSVLRTWIEQDRIGELPGLWSAYIGEALLLIYLVCQPRLRRR